MHAPSEKISDDLKDSFYQELEQVFDHFPKYNMKFLLRNLMQRRKRKNTFKPTIGDEGLHHDSNGNGVRIVNFDTSKT